MNEAMVGLEFASWFREPIANPELPRENTETTKKTLVVGLLRFDGHKLGGSNVRNPKS